MMYFTLQGVEEVIIDESIFVDRVISEVRKQLEVIVYPADVELGIYKQKGILWTLKVPFGVVQFVEVARSGKISIESLYYHRM